MLVLLRQCEFNTNVDKTTRPLWREVLCLDDKSYKAVTGNEVPEDTLMQDAWIDGSIQKAYVVVTGIPNAHERFYSSHDIQSLKCPMAHGLSDFRQNGARLFHAHR